MSATQTSRRGSAGRRGALVAAWLLLVVAGLLVLIDHGAAPGAPAAAPERWPAGSRVGRSAGLATLVVFAHPGCPCTRATLAELARLAPELAGRASVEVVLAEVAGAEEDGQGIRAAAAAIPGVRIATDPRGVERRRFGALTSGQVLLYDAAGKLAFAGGITPGRGHEGDSFGAAAIRSFVRGERLAGERARVFGCAFADAAGASGGRW